MKKDFGKCGIGFLNLDLGSDYSGSDVRVVMASGITSGGSSSEFQDKVSVGGSAKSRSISSDDLFLSSSSGVGVVVLVVLMALVALMVVLVLMVVALSYRICCKSCQSSYVISWVYFVIQVVLWGSPSGLSSDGLPSDFIVSGSSGLLSGKRLSSTDLKLFNDLLKCYQGLQNFSRATNSTNSGAINLKEANSGAVNLKEANSKEASSKVISKQANFSLDSSSGSLSRGSVGEVVRDSSYGSCDVNLLIELRTKLEKKLRSVSKKAGSSSSGRSSFKGKGFIG